MKRKVTVPVVMLAVLSSQAVMAKAVTIQYWGSWSFISKAEKKVCDNFNKLHEGKIIVKPMDVSDPETKTLTAAAGGAAPDLFKIDRFKVGSFAAKDVLTDLSPYIKKDKINSNIFFKPTWNETIYGGRPYALPWNTDSRPLYYNKTMFKTAGLDPERPPKTWEDLTLYSKKLEVQVNGKYSRTGFIPTNGNWGFVGWLFSAGGDVTDATGKKVTWNNPAGIKAASYVADTLARFGGVGKVNAASSFTGGKAGMEIQVSDQMRGYKFELGAAAPPRPSGLEKDVLTWSGGFALAIPRGSKHPKEAWEFIKYYCTNKEAQLILGTEGTGQIPVLKAAAYDERFLKSSKVTRTTVELLEEGRFRPVIPAGEELWKLYSDTVNSELTSAKRSPVDILNRTASEAQKILDRAWARVRRH